MVKFWATTVVLTAACLGAARADEPAAEPAPKVSKKFEYAELVLSATTVRAAARAGGGAAANPAPGAGGPGGPGGAGGLGGFGGRATTRRVTTATWVTGSGKVEADSFAELATKLKLPAPKKELSEEEQRVRILNHLGGQGWEMVSGGLGGLANAPMTFKRQLAK